MMVIPKHIVMTVLIQASIIRPLCLVEAQQVDQANAEFGARQTSGEFASSKFGEYRELPQGIFVNAFSLNFINSGDNNAFSVWGANVAQRDQNFFAQMRQSGIVKLQASWDQTPHLYTNTARTIYNRTSDGVLEIPQDVRSRLRSILAADINPAVRGVQYDTTALVRLVNGMARASDVQAQRDKWKAAFSYMPVDELAFKFDYSNERRSGTRQLGGEFFYHTPAEVLEPTDYRTQEASARVEYAAKAWNLGFSYTYSLFNNNVDVLVWDNPFRETDLIAGTSRARLDLYPDNSSQRLSMSGGVNLPFATRLMTTASYDARSQNQAFIPFTINAAIETLSTVPQLPSQSLHGDVGLTLVNVSLTNRLFPVAWLAARYRLLDYDNRTPGLLFPGYVDQDNLITRTQRASLPTGYRKENISADVTVRLLSILPFKAGYEREIWDRRLREAGQTREDMVRLSLDYTPRGWASVRTSYSLGKKNTADDDPRIVEQETFPAGRPLSTVGQLEQLRMFDLASRTRKRANAMLTITPIQELALSGSFGLENDDFDESAYGMSLSRMHNFSWDMTVMPISGFSLTASYTREYSRNSMRSRQRVFGNDTTMNDWSSDLGDQVNTYGFSCGWDVVPEQVDLTVHFTLSDAKGTTATQAPGDPGDRRFFVTTAENYPDTRSIVRQLRAAIRYRLTDHFSPRLEYRFEGYSESYFYQDIMQTFMIATEPDNPRAVYLGARQPSYAAHLISMVLSYDF